MLFNLLISRNAGRLVISKDHEFSSSEKLAVFCARVEYIQQGWRLIRLLNMKGKDTHATLLVKFTINALA